MENVKETMLINAINLKYDVAAIYVTSSMASFNRGEKLLRSNGCNVHAHNGKIVRAENESFEMMCEIIMENLEEQLMFNSSSIEPEIKAPF